MNKYFSQIIFPPLPKIKEADIILFDSTLGNLLDLEYFFEYTGASTRLMVKCPSCSKIYCYSTLTSHTLTYDIELGIRDHPKFFNNEWKINCPDASIHCELSSILRD
jgi:hypothetical protein